jgi:hypothetical protein
MLKANYLNLRLTRSAFITTYMSSELKLSKGFFIGNI